MSLHVSQTKLTETANLMAEQLESETSGRDFKPQPAAANAGGDDNDLPALVDSDDEESRPLIMDWRDKMPPDE